MGAFGECWGGGGYWRGDLVLKDLIHFNEQQEWLKSDKSLFAEAGDE